MFIDREKELGNLNRLYASDKFEFAVIYGSTKEKLPSLTNSLVDGGKQIQRPEGRLKSILWEQLIRTLLFSENASGQMKK